MHTPFDGLEGLRELREGGVETFILSIWSPPAWQKANLSLNYQQPGFQGKTSATANRLDYHQYEEFAETVVAAIRMLREESGIEVSAVGLQNEPAFHQPYASAILDPEHFIELIRVVGRRFEREGIETRLMMPEQVFGQTDSLRQYIEALNADPEARDFCDIIAVHGYDDAGVEGARLSFDGWSDLFERAQGGSAKELWMTEAYPTHRDWSSAFEYALTLYGAFEYGRIGLWTSWALEGQLLHKGKLNSSGFVFSQFARFIRPGAVRITSRSPDPEILVTSYLNPSDGRDRLSSVLINQSDVPKAIRLDVRGNWEASDVRVFRTDPVARAEEGPAVDAHDIILLTAKSVTTVVQSPVEGSPPNRRGE